VVVSSSLEEEEREVDVVEYDEWTMEEEPWGGRVFRSTAGDTGEENE